MKKLLLIDAGAVIHRAYHALPKFTNKKGQLVNAAYGFFSILIKAVKDIKPNYLVVAFDVPKPTFRHQEYDQYQATRIRAPQELYDQIPIIREILKTMDVAMFEKAGFEADDVLATIAEKAKKISQIFVVTGDMDILQLVDKNLEVYAMRRGMSDVVIYNQDKVRERYGLPPVNIPDYKGLAGDSSDNIPGVPGIGPGTASKLISEYGNLEKIYHNEKKIPEKYRKLLLPYKGQAEMSKKLATLVRNVELNFNLNQAKFLGLDRAKVIQKFETVGFKSLAKRIANHGGPKQPKTEKNSQRKLFQ